MFFVLQKIHIKWSPNGIKTYGDFFWNKFDFWEVESMRDDARGAHEGEGSAPGGQARLGPSLPLCKAAVALLSPQESQYPDKNRVQISAQPELRISGNIRNGERAESGNAETERDRSNLGGALAPPPPWRPWTRGETLLPSRGKVKEEEEEGGSLPLCFGGAGTPPGAIIITAIFTNNFTAFITNSSPLYAVV